MERVLVVGFVSGESLPASVREGLTWAGQIAAALEANLTVGLLGSGVREAAGRIAGAGAAPIWAVEGDEFESSRYATDALALEAICRRSEATIVVAVGGPRVNRVLPGVAARMDGVVDTHVGAWRVDEGTLLVTRWFYRQRMTGSLSRSRRPWFLVFDPGTASSWEGPAGAVDVEILPVAVPDEAKRTRVLEIVEPPPAERTIRPDAELLFVAGAGWTKRQADGQVHSEKAEKLIVDFLRLSQASLGGSKSIVDLSGEGQKALSFMSYMNQIGQTGATPRHPKGLATCCHGEEPHAVGWRFVNERRAVNLDPACGWARGKADVLYVADAFAVMERDNELLAED